MELSFLLAGQIPLLEGGFEEWESFQCLYGAGRASVTRADRLLVPSVRAGSADGRGPSGVDISCDFTRKWVRLTGVTYNRPGVKTVWEENVKKNVAQFEKVSVDPEDNFAEKKYLSISRTLNKLVLRN